MDGEPLAFSLSYFFGRLPHPGWLVPVGLETSNDRYWSASREPQRSMTSRGYDPRQSPGLGYKRVVSCKDSFHGTDVLAVSELPPRLTAGQMVSARCLAMGGEGGVCDP